MNPRVLAAAGVLDEDMPGWHRKINLDTLDLDLCWSCVIGQVYGIKRDTVGSHALFRDELERLFGSTDADEADTFACDDCHGPDWRALIRARQDADRIADTALAGTLETVLA